MMRFAYGGFPYVTYAHAGVIRHLNKHTCSNIVCQQSNKQIKRLRVLCGVTIDHTSTHKRRTKRGLWSVLTKAWVDRCVWTFTPLHRQSGRGARVMQAQAEANSHFPASKSQQLRSVWCPGSPGFPTAQLVNTTWPRIHCGGAVSVDSGDRLLFSLCFHVEVRALWAFVCSGSWVGVGFQCGIRYMYNYSSRVIRQTKVST